MKRIHLTPLAVFAVLLLLTVSCKKNNPLNPINGGGDGEPCSACLSKTLELEGVYDSSGMLIDTILVSTNYAQATDFWEYGQNKGIGNFAYTTHLGLSGAFNKGASIAFNTESVMDCPPTKLTFVHARTDHGMVNYPPALLNVQLPGTPIICTTADSLAQYLSPYGYTVQRFHHPGLVWFSKDPTMQVYTGEIDSIIVKGPAFQQFIVGASMIESELRSICVEHD